MKLNELNIRVAFLRPIEGARSTTGGSRNGYEEAFQSWANVHYLRGGEGVLGSRMAGRRPAILTVRRRSVLNQIEHGWAVQIDGQDFQIRELPRITKDRRFAEMLVEAIL